MNKAFVVDDAPRTVPAGVTADLPIITVAWRALRPQCESLAAERRLNQEEVRRLVDAASAAAEAVHCAGRGDAPAHLRRASQALNAAGIEIVAPAGEPYTGDRMEQLDNVAQRFEPGLSEPRIAEVIEPAILYRGAIVRMGKAVIAVPADLEPGK